MQCYPWDVAAADSVALVAVAAEGELAGEDPTYFLVAVVEGDTC